MLLKGVSTQKSIYSESMWPLKMRAINFYNYLKIGFT